MVKKVWVALSFALLFGMSVNIAWAVTPAPTPTLAPWICPYETDSAYRPGGACKQEVPFVNIPINDYPITCGPAPAISLPYSTCNPPGTHTCPSGNGTCITVKSTLGYELLQLGGLGPDAEINETQTYDTITAFYPFNGLADKPLNTIGAPRESFQTFWRLLNQNQQMNAKAKILKRFTSGGEDKNRNFSSLDPNFPPLFDSQFPYSTDVAAAPIEHGGTAPNNPTNPSSSFCVDVFVSKDAFDIYKAQLSKFLAKSNQPDFWKSYFIGYYNKLGATSKPYLFENVCGGKPCYQYILDSLSSKSCSDGTYINPSLAIAIALNETGGLGSANADGSNPDHFGCDRGGSLSSSTIPSKFSCFMNTIMKGCGKSAADVLGPKGYGYLSDSNLTNLISLLNMPAATSCSSSGSSTTTTSSSSSSGGSSGGLAKNGAPQRYFDDPPPVEEQPVRSHPCGAGQEDMLDYFLPTDSSLVNIMANGEQLQTYPTHINGRTGFVETKSEDHHYFEEFLYDDQYIYHLRDTTWDNKCVNTGRRAFYSLFDTDGKTEGGQYMQRCVTPGQSYTVNVYINSYDRTTCKPCNAGIGVQSPLAGTTNKFELKDGKMYVTSTAGSGAGETKIFAKGRGMIGFQDDKAFKVESDATGTINKTAEPLINTCKDMPDEGYFTLSELASSLPSCLTNYPVCADAARTYLNLDKVLRAKYEAFMPFDFDSARGYLATRFIDPETKQDTTKIVGENLAYVYATNDLLNDSGSGIANMLSPQWLNDLRKGLMTNNTIIKPESKTSDTGYLNDTLYKPISKDAKTVWSRDQLKGIQGCMEFTKGPSMGSPTTNPQALPGADGVYTQNVEVPVTIESEGDKSKCPVYNDAGVVIGEGPKYTVKLDNSNVTRAEGSPVQDLIGRSVAVINNPKMWDISRTLAEGGAGGENYSLTYMFTPKSLQKTYEELNMKAQTVRNNVDTGTPDQPNQTNTSTKYVGRKGGSAEVSLCLMRNFALLPANLQLGLPSDCEDPKLASGNASSSGALTNGSATPTPTPAP